MEARRPTLPWIAGRGQALPALFQHEAADGAFVVLGPDHEHVGDRAVGDPHLGAGELVAAVDLPGARDHAAGVGAVVGFGQAEAADPLAGGQLGQVLLLGGFVAELVDRHHHQRRLHAHHRAVAGVDALDFARHQAVADVVQAGAAVGLGDGGAQQAQLAHLAKDRRRRSSRCGRLPARAERGAPGSRLAAASRTARSSPVICWSSSSGSAQWKDALEVPMKFSACQVED